MIDVPYPGGESWRQATDRVGRFLTDLPTRWAGQRVVVIGHIATRWGLDRFTDGPGSRTWTRRTSAGGPAGSTCLPDLTEEGAARGDLRVGRGQRSAWHSVVV